MPEITKAQYEQKKVFCKGCKFFYIGTSELHFACRADENLRQRYSWLEISYSPINHPKVINENNDCKWFEEAKRNRYL